MRQSEEVVARIKAKTQAHAARVRRALEVYDACEKYGPEVGAEVFRTVQRRMEQEQGES